MKRRALVSMCAVVLSICVSTSVRAATLDGDLAIENTHGIKEDSEMLLQSVEADSSETISHGDAVDAIGSQVNDADSNIIEEVSSDDIEAVETDYPDQLKKNISKGWIQENSGQWRYYQEDGTYIKNAWKEIDGQCIILTKMAIRMLVNG